MHKQFNYIGFVLLALALAVPASAQTLGVQADPVQVLVSPKVPAPGETVRIEVQGIGTFLGDATITWRQDGTTVKTGTGERVFTFVAGSLGKLTRIGLTINSATEGVITRTLNFIPSTVNLVWEADTSVPPLYRGKALYSPGSNVTVIAFPQIVANGATISSNNLTFQWQRGGEAVPAYSGKGRNTFSFAGKQLQGGENIQVDVFLDSVLVGQGSVSIAASAPQVLLYPRDPLRGVLWGQALPAAISLTAREITVQAVPYFFANESLFNDDLVYKWELNNRTTTGPNAASGIMTLRQTGEGAGSATLSVALQNTNNLRLLQSAEAAVRMVFGSQSNTGLSSFFGL